MREIPYKIYLEEHEMPKQWYNVRADMKKKPAPLLNPVTLQPSTLDELSKVFCRELAKQELDDTTAKIKQYIDTHYATITSVNEIAEHFFYTREHLSRIFKESFNISVAQYLSRKRVLESLPLLSTLGATNAGYTVGFRNHLTFINAFKRIMGCLPSEYKAKL